MLVVCHDQCLAHSHHEEVQAQVLSIVAGLSLLLGLFIPAEVGWLCRIQPVMHMSREANGAIWPLSMVGCLHQPLHAKNLMRTQRLVPVCSMSAPCKASPANCQGSCHMCGTGQMLQSYLVDAAFSRPGLRQLPQVTKLALRRTYQHLLMRA